MKCLVTGATGFIGRALCPALVQRGHTVCALGRSALAAPAVDTLVVDLATTALTTEQLAGVDVVIHLAGVAHQKASADSYRQVNRDATLALAQAAQAAGVRHFIFVSSVKAMGPAVDATARGEADTALPQGPYGLSKWQAEEGLRAMPADGPMAITILRPALVYGPEPKGNLALLDRGIDMGLPRPPALGGRSMVALPDLVELLCHLVAADTQGVHTWIVCDGQSYSSRAIHDALRARRGVAPARSWCPRWAWLATAGLLGLRERLFGFEHYDSSAVQAATGWQPRHQLADVLGASTR